MDITTIRKRFVDFYAARQHVVVPSASLIPADPTLLLTNAGMVPFKPYFLGEEKAPYERAVTIQKCVRTIDVDIIGTTARHLSFFEMMGNFSFGDYFKEKAIPWAYELVTEQFELDPERLWFTVHETDDEAAEIWLDGVGIRPDRLQRTDRDNFWQMGVPGPCGPSSEIFYDKGASYGLDGGPVVDEERFMELWNLVFMQNIQDEPYHVVGDLPAKNIDTGAGLERVATVLQAVESVFYTDGLRSVVASAEGATGARFGSSERTDVSLRIMADHARSVSFLMADHVVPSNEGRGYVLRRLLRRAVRHASLLGADDMVMPRMIAAVVASVGEAYPDLRAKQDAISEMAAREESQFRRTLQSGHQLLDAELDGMGEGDVLPGATAFKLHDTYGFPLELTEEILSERGLQLDREEFERMMTVQRERARAHFRGGDAAAQADAYRALLAGVDATEFIGYIDEAGTGRILSIVREGEVVESAEAGQEVEVFLDRTPFYAESGGQVGDIGTIATETGEIRVADTQHAVQGVHGHRGRIARGIVAVGQEATAEIDHERREHIRKNHTGTHVLHWALREVIGDHAHQAGSLVAPDRLRFDFSHFTATAPQELLEVERAVNERIIANAQVRTVEASKEEAQAMGALAFFGDKYGERVRVVQVGGFSIEFCGGTHVATSGQVGPLVLISEGSVAANTRRIEALTGTAAYLHLVELRSTLERAAEVLRAQPGQLVDAAEALTVRLEEQEERLARFEARATSDTAAALAEQIEHLGERQLIVAGRPGLDGKELRALAIQLRDRMTSGVGVVGSVDDGKAALIAFVTPDLVADGVSAGDLVAEAARIVGGGASRDPSLAQAGGPRGDELESALGAALAAAREALGGR
ncbi:MAG TPA: alanine--tRNA ligase [Acidimicrobiia bacterium]|jgi:alanyl-tRNA synthetase